MQQRPILLQEGWEKLKVGAVEKIQGILEDMKEGITIEEYSMLYTCDYYSLATAKHACFPTV